jgi:hypothetical protein
VVETTSGQRKFICDIIPAAPFNFSQINYFRSFFPGTSLFMEGRV